MFWKPTVLQLTDIAKQTWNSEINSCPKTSWDVLSLFLSLSWHWVMMGCLFWWFCLVRVVGCFVPAMKCCLRWGVSCMPRLHCLNLRINLACWSLGWLQSVFCSANWKFSFREAMKYTVCAGNKVGRLNHAVSSSLAKWRVEPYELQCPWKLKAVR